MGILIEDKVNVGEEIKRLGVLAEWTQIVNASDFNYAYKTLQNSNTFTICIYSQKWCSKALIEKWTFIIEKEK